MCLKMKGMRTSWMAVLLCLMIYGGCGGGSDEPVCTPEEKKCDGKDVIKCNSAGTEWAFYKECDKYCAGAECTADAPLDVHTDSLTDAGTDIVSDLVADTAHDTALEIEADETGVDICEADCGGKQCGDNGCGGECGECGAGELCSGEGMCEVDCAVACDGVECGSVEVVCDCGTCEDGNVCTDDACVDGACIYENNATDCDDGDACTESDVCSEGACEGAALNCDDGNVCTDDVCLTEGSMGCSSAPVDDGTACDDGWECLSGACTCVPNCEGKECGPDSCDGTCDECQGSQDTCVDGLCVCQPACEGVECGADGCGGTCGVCAQDSYCDNGQCNLKCGDGSCDGQENETCNTCPLDCGACCGNGVCDFEETCDVCPQDCGECPLCGPQCGILEECIQTAAGWTCVGATAEVPPGSFWMGCNQSVDTCCACPGWSENECSYHEVIIQGFYIDITEVTYSQYAAFMNWLEGEDLSNQCAYEGAIYDCIRPPSENPPLQQAGNVWVVEPGMGNRPVVNVPWYGAKAYCEWAGKRLPSEAEWEKAARGGCELYSNCEEESPRWPWGSDLANCDLAVMVLGGVPGCGTGGAMDVCSKEAGNSPYGLCDMAGNVMEWTQDCNHGNYDGSPNDGTAWEEAGCVYRVRRGGMYGYASCSIRVSFRAALGATIDHVAQGFRCAMP